MNTQLTGKVALITGASKGIGRQTAAQLAGEGCDVAITGRTESDIISAAAQIQETTGRQALGLPGDMAVHSDIQWCVEAVIEQFGRIDILVSCAGSAPGGLFEDVSEDQWLTSLKLKLLGYVHTVRAVIRKMKQQGEGSIVLVVGNNGLKPSYWEITGGTANAADINFASAIAEQYGPQGIRCNTVNPGPVDTERLVHLEAALARDKNISVEQAHRIVLDSLPLNKVCTPADVANLICFLASPLSTHLNGTHIPIDGGQRKALIDVL